jgi:hypothetical protein
MRKTALLLCVLAILVPAMLVLPLTVRAQAQISLSSLSIDLWPEFDHPDVLVMYKFTLSPKVSLPAEVQIRIPANASANAVAVCQSDGSCFNTPYETRQEGGWTVLVIQATMPDLQVEYYDPNLQKDGANRHYSYTWPGDYTVDALKVSVQQPAGAQGMQIKPGMKPTTGNDGLTYYEVNAGSLAAGQTFEIVVDYQKTDDQLTYNNLPVAPSEPLDSTESGRASPTSALPIVLGLVGVLLIVGGGVWYWRSGRQSPGARNDRRVRRRSSASSAGVEVVEAGHIYCHQCGKRATGGDRYCRACGAELRIT